MNSEKLDKKEKNLPETWRNAADSMSIEELKNCITVEAARRDKNERELLDDEEVNQIKANLEDAVAGYKEIREDTATKIRYLVKVLKSKQV